MKKWILIGAATAAIVSLTPSVQAATTYYIVQKGDTLTAIAAQYNTTIEQLKQWNALTSDRIFVEQKLLVKKSSSTEAVSSKKIATTTSSTIKTYTVVKGDTLTKIATKYNTTVTNLKNWNQLTSDLILINQRLVVSKQSDVKALQAVANTTAPMQSLPVISTPTPSTPTVSAEDVAINNQLASEAVISKNPSVEGIATYTRLLKVAEKYKGVPYLFGGNTPAGFDCSGFISYVFNEAGISLKRKSSLDYFMNDTVTVKNPVPGDVVFFKNTYISTISHMGIYIGNNEMIHAGSNGVEVTKLSYKYWSERQVAFKRFKQIQ